uniref:Putative Dihydrolipoyl dehydrogenase n=1 Tax=Magnetococcus massalia (strain MO-1) TaxID=451514 RepID=A0A1S7LLR9_MAGMO|nr:putative Dihydrolipoyl dehydrogenase [Candidatus Magnetococcus massalia]
MAEQVDVAIIGAGTAGLYAMSLVRQKTKNFVLIDQGPLGTTCARVGCMPSKALIQTADDYHLAKRLVREGLISEPPAMESAAGPGFARKIREMLSSKISERVSGNLGEKLIQDRARFVAKDTIEVAGRTIQAKAIILATGSESVMPAPWKAFGDRVIDSEGLFNLEQMPKSMAVLGLGAIGLELGQAISTLGVDVTGFDLADTVAMIQDPKVRDMALEQFGKQFPIHLGHGAELAEGSDGKIKVTAGDVTAQVEKVLVSLGRKPRLADMGLAEIGLELDARGVPKFDTETTKVEGAPIYIAGDCNGDRVIFHEAADEGKMAAFNVLRETPQRFKRKSPLGIVFTDPNIASFGISHDEAVACGAEMAEATIHTESRAKVIGIEAGMVRLYADKRDGRLLGGALLSPRGEHIAHTLIWAVQGGLTVHELATMPYYHPNLEEALFSVTSALSKSCDGGYEGMPPGLIPAE